MNPLFLLMGAQNATHGIGQPFYGDNGVGDLKGLTDELARLQASRQAPAAPAPVHPAGPPVMPNLFPQAQANSNSTPSDALSAYKSALSAGDQFSNKDAKDDKQVPSPIDRIKAAFAELKDMHRDNASNGVGPGLGLFPGASVQPPSVMGTAQGYMGGMAPAPAPAPAAPSAPPSVPLPMARPADAPQAPSPMMSLFARSSAMQRDPLTGDYIDPAAAHKAEASPGIFSHLFG